MNNFIQLTDYDATIHRDILDSLLREQSGSSAVIEVCENRAIAIVRGLLNSRYDCDKVFAAAGDERNALVLKICLDIAVYEIFCQHNPYKMSEIRKDRYDDAMQFLRDVHDYKANIEGLPELPPDTQGINSPWQIAANDPWNPYF